MIRENEMDLALYGGPPTVVLTTVSESELP